MERFVAWFTVVLIVVVVVAAVLFGIYPGFAQWVWNYPTEAI